MSSVTFLGPLKPGGKLERLEVRLSPSRYYTLLDLFRQYGLPKACGCGKGQCGSCAVKVAVLGGRARYARTRLSKTEREALFASGKLTRQQYESRYLTTAAPLWRLACQYVIRDQDIVVAYH